MGIYIIGDIHLSKDESINKPMDDFGEVWENHSQKLEENWKNIATAKDTVIIAGDISWALRQREAIADLDWLDNMPGKKILIKGNHDLWWHGIKRLNSMYSSIDFLQNTAIETENCVICGTRGWICPGEKDFQLSDEKIYKREVLRLEASLEKGAKTGKKIIGVMHFPPTNETKDLSRFTALFEKYKVANVYYGHLHTERGFQKGLIGNLNSVNYNLVSYDYLQGQLKEIE